MTVAFIIGAMTKKNQSIFVYKLARAGAVAIGIVYTLVGVVALLSLMQVRRGGAEEASVIALMDKIPMGRVVIALIFLGLVAFIIWKFYNAIKDPYGYGSHFKGTGKRLGIAAGGLAYGTIALSAVKAFLDLTNATHGSPQDQRLMVAQIFDWSAGEWIVAIFGAGVALTGLAQFVYVIRRGYREKISVSTISTTKKRIIAFLAWSGHFARGTILLIIAFFLIKASLESEPSEVVNTDKAFNFLGDEVGHWSFVLVAVGTICYGFYMFFLSRYYDFQDDF